ncbi:MAG: hypothetical protein CM1200mP40_07670 [Gammaproteobacteria bacterium]|nr:MAG: hypothetical protein CM1200mP40_07670 [Gammaproteobacteria bacterium]
MFDGFSKELISNQSLEGGRIYDPRRGKFYSSELSLLENGNLLVEGCLLFICDGEEWFPLEVTINSDGSRQATFKNPPGSLAARCFPSSVKQSLIVML